MPERKPKQSTLFPRGLKVELRITSEQKHEDVKNVKDALKAHLRNTVPSLIQVESQVLTKVLTQGGMVTMFNMVFESPPDEVVEKVRTDASTA